METAQNLLDAGENGLVIVGVNALQHPDASLIKNLAQLISDMTGARLAILDAANSVAGHIAVCKPGTSGMNAREMLESPRQAYLLMGCEPELDSLNSASALNAMESPGKASKGRPMIRSLGIVPPNPWLDGSSAPCLKMTKKPALETMLRPSPIIFITRSIRLKLALETPRLGWS